MTALLRLGDQPPDRPAEAQRLRTLGHRRIGVDRVAVVVGARRRSRDASGDLRRGVAASGARRPAASAPGRPRSCTSSRPAAARCVADRRAPRPDRSSAARIPAAKPSGVGAGQDRDLVVEHLRVRQQPRGDDRPARPQVLIDLQRRVGAGAARRHQHVGRVEVARESPPPAAGRRRSPRRRRRRARPRARAASI